MKTFRAFGAFRCLRFGRLTVPRVVLTTAGAMNSAACQTNNA